MERDRCDHRSDLDSFGNFVTSAGHFDRFFSHDVMSGSLIFSSFSLHTLVRHFPFSLLLRCGESCRPQRCDAGGCARQ